MPAQRHAAVDGLVRAGLAPRPPPAGAGRARGPGGERDDLTAYPRRRRRRRARARRTADVPDAWRGRGGRQRTSTTLSPRCPRRTRASPPPSRRPGRSLGGAFNNRAWPALAAVSSRAPTKVAAPARSSRRALAASPTGPPLPTAPAARRPAPAARRGGRRTREAPARRARAFFVPTRRARPARPKAQPRRDEVNSAHVVQPRCRRRVAAILGVGTKRARRRAPPPRARPASTARSAAAARSAGSRPARQRARTRACREPVRWGFVINSLRGWHGCTLGRALCPEERQGSCRCRGEFKRRRISALRQGARSFLRSGSDTLEESAPTFT